MMTIEEIRALVVPTLIEREGSPEAALTKAVAMARHSITRLADLTFGQGQAACCSTTRIRRLAEIEDASRDLTAAFAVIDILAGDALDQLAAVGGDLSKLGGFS